jgi:hypothetical protein
MEIKSHTISYVIFPSYSMHVWNLSHGGTECIEHMLQELCLCSEA